MWWQLLPLQWKIYKETRQAVYENEKAKGASATEATKKAQAVALDVVNVTGDKPTFWERVKFWSPLILIAYAIYKIAKR